MKEAIIYYSMVKDGRRVHGSRRLQVPEEMYKGWDWSGIEKLFLSCFKLEDRHKVSITQMRLGRYVLQG